MHDEKYAWPQILLHWVSAIVIVWLLISGFLIAYVDVGPAAHAVISFANVALGTLYIPVFMLRWLCSLLHAKPRSTHHNARFRALATAVHLGLYWSTAAVLLSGVLMMNRAIDLFGWASIAPVVADPAWQARWFTVHIASCVVLAVLLLMHVGAVLMHQMLGRQVLRRMLP